MPLPKLFHLDENLIAQCSRKATGANIHNVNVRIGMYKGAVLSYNVNYCGSKEPQLPASNPLL